MPKSIIILVVVVVVLSIAIVGGAYFLKNRKTVPQVSTANQTDQKSAQQTNVSSKSKRPSVITDCTPPQVDTSTLAFFAKDTNVYGLRAKILSVAEAANGKILITDIEGVIPNFTVTPKTKVLLVQNNGKTESAGSVNDVRAGQKVVISIHCGTNKTWITSVLRIMPNLSATPKP